MVKIIALFSKLCKGLNLTFEEKCQLLELVTGSEAEKILLEWFDDQEKMIKKLEELS